MWTFSNWHNSPPFFPPSQHLSEVNMAERVLTGPEVIQRASKSRVGIQTWVYSRQTWDFQPLCQTAICINWSKKCDRLYKGVRKLSSVKANLWQCSHKSVILETPTMSINPARASHKRRSVGRRLSYMSEILYVASKALKSKFNICGNIRKGGKRERVTLLWNLSKQSCFPCALKYMGTTYAGDTTSWMC